MLKDKSSAVEIIVNVFLISRLGFPRERANNNVCIRVEFHLVPFFRFSSGVLILTVMLVWCCQELKLRPDNHLRSNLNLEN